MKDLELPLSRLWVPIKAARPSHKPMTPPATSSLAEPLAVFLAVWMVKIVRSICSANLSPPPRAIRGKESAGDLDLGGRDHLLDSCLQVYLVRILGALLHKQFDDLRLLVGTGTAVTVLNVSRPRHTFG